jgi:class 3 adenylate cyclase/tetratricopeptide (TPR) repeat protein
VPECPSCGHENGEDARFCSACGAALTTPEATREQRKVVTVLFCDLVGSTALGESTDPEALRARMRRYFEDLRVILERHGGTVEKFVGDAVMAVFGIPVSHEDDALRAVRAAAEMQAQISEHGLEARIGINTGEVVVGGEGETLVTGDAVNVAARLEQAAGAGEVFIGAETQSLVRDAVRVEAVEPLALKGKAEPVDAFSLLEVLPESEGLARNPEALLVGRKRERNRLWRDFEDVLDESSCRLVTLLGPAGIGKSRLVADFVERVGDSADILRGRCLSYGEGITYWPLVEILIAIGVEPDSVIGTSPPETQLAFRRLLEARAAERPQVVIVDDLQWAEPVFIDLVEHIADLSRDAPVFLLCVARTELLDVRPDWGGGKMNATAILLEPLGDDECEALIGNLLGDARLEDDLRDRIMAASAGNPLYVEEMLAMVREHGGDGEIVVPPTIHALLQARIDSLDGDVRVVMERGSVEGEVFHRGAVAELSPAPVRADVGSHLTTLVRKELIRSAPPTFPDDEGFRFRHLLIRDAAYESLPKATRAELHERFADWLTVQELVERDEIVGYHLEQAYRYRTELDSADPRLPLLADGVAARLGAAGRGALERGDVHASLALLRRATSVLPDGDDRRHELAPHLALALWDVGDLAAATSVLADASKASDPVIGAVSVILTTVFDTLTTGTLNADERHATKEAAYRVLADANDDEGLAIYWWTVATEHWFQLNATETIAAAERGLEHIRRPERPSRFEVEFVWLIRSASVLGPMPVDEALARLDRLEVGARESQLLDASSDGARARLLACQGNFESARELARSARETMRSAGATVVAAGMAMFEAWVEQRAGNLEAWERLLRTGLEELEGSDEVAFRATIIGYVAECLYEQGRFDEAHDLCRVVRDMSPPDDVINFVYADAIEGVVLVRRGFAEEGVRLLEGALARVDVTDFYFSRAETRLMLAEAYSTVGELDRASSSAAEALDIYSAKGDIAGLRRAEERIARLGEIV